MAGCTPSKRRPNTSTGAAKLFGLAFNSAQNGQVEFSTGRGGQRGEGRSTLGRPGRMAGSQVQRKGLGGADVHKGINARSSLIDNPSRLPLPKNKCCGVVGTSLVLMMSRYWYWSLSSLVSSSFSLRTLTATTPNLSSVPKQLECSVGRHSKTGA